MLEKLSGNLSHHNKVLKTGLDFLKDIIDFYMNS